MAGKTAAPTAAGGGPGPAVSVGPGPGSGPSPSPAGRGGLLARIETLYWWGHSVWALCLGIGVALFANEGFGRARILAVSLVVAWAVILALFRVFGSGRARNVQDASLGTKLKYYAMTGVLKNMFQGMLFFLLPWYAKAGAVLDRDALGGPTTWFVLVLGALALLSTVDVVFDHFVMKFRSVAAVFYFLVLFACANLVVPALLPATRSLLALTLAGALATVAVWTIYLPLRAFARPMPAALLMITAVGGGALAYAARPWIPPVAMHMVHGGVGPTIDARGQLEFEIRRVQHQRVPELYAVTEIAAPGGRGDRLVHEWRHKDTLVFRAVDIDTDASERGGTVSLASRLRREDLPADIIGPWRLEVRTTDGQLVGLVPFEVVE